MGIEHSKHIFRIFILLAFVIVAAFIGRLVLIKATLPSFGLLGHYRADSLKENAAREVRHGEVLHEEFQLKGNLNKSCKGCHVKDGEGEEQVYHDDIWESHREGAHQAVPCESCHDALAVHVKDGRKIAEMPRLKDVDDLCGRCHLQLDARPADFPQVDIVSHPGEMAEDPEELAGVPLEEICFACHSPHDPTP